MIVGDNVEQRTPKRVKDLHFHQIDAETDQKAEALLFEKEQIATNEVHNEDDGSQKNDGTHESNEVHVGRAEEVAREVDGLVRFDEQRVEVGHEIEVAVRAPNQKVEAVGADGERRVNEQSERLNNPQRFEEQFVDSPRLQHEGQEQQREEGHHYEIEAVLDDVRKVLSHKLGSLIETEDVCRVVVLNSVLTVELTLEHDLERFVVSQRRRNVGCVIDAVSGVLKVANRKCDTL